MKQLVDLGNGRKITRYGSRSKLKAAFNRRYGNSTTAFVPEMWASEAVRLLWEMMPWAGIVSRDFDPAVARFGETVHTRRIGTLTAKRKQNDMDNLETGTLTATDIEVKLNQRVYSSFLVGDGERSKSFQDLVTTYLEPAVMGCVQFLDRAVAGQVYQFMGNSAGLLSGMTSSNGHEYLLDARQVMNDNKVSDQNRWMGLASGSETMMQKSDLFKSAERVGDGGRALRDAILGRKAGFNNFLSLNVPSVRTATVDTATTTAAAAAKGATTVSATATVVAGKFVVIAGVPYRVLSVTGSGPYALVIDRGLRDAVASGAALQSVSTGLINQASAIAAGDTTAAVADGYPSGWMKAITVDGTGAPKIGQLVAFKAAGGTVHTPWYAIVQVDGSDIYLDRPLESTLADNDIVCYGPNGDFNFGLQRDALTLVNRPLAQPEAGTGARSSVGVFENMSLRIVITYDGLSEAHRVTVSGLFGLKVLESAKGVVMFG